MDFERGFEEFLRRGCPEWNNSLLCDEEFECENVCMLLGGGGESFGGELSSTGVAILNELSFTNNDDQLFGFNESISMVPFNFDQFMFPSDSTCRNDDDRTIIPFTEKDQPETNSTDEFLRFEELCSTFDFSTTITCAAIPSTSNQWKVSVEQVDPKSQIASFNFRTKMRIRVQCNRRFAKFKPIHIGFISTNKNPTITFMNNEILPTEMHLQWSEFGHRCYNTCRKGLYLVVLKVEPTCEQNSQIHHLGLVVQVGRNNQKGTNNTKDIPVMRYSWFEMDESFELFVDETNPQLLSLWSSKDLDENNSVHTGVSFPDKKDRNPKDRAQQKEKRTRSATKRKHY